MDHFTKPKDFYERQINPVRAYREQSAFYLSKVRNISIEKATDMIAEKMKVGDLPMVDKEVVCYVRGDNGDKRLETTSLLGYIKDTITSRYILAPTFTNYVPDTFRVSPVADFTAGNVKQRSILKAEAFVAKAEKNMAKYTFKNNGQSRMKTYNNSLSGAFATKGSVFYNPTAHSTLTSITRIETSLANSLNEKLIAGNRHYSSLKMALNNINYLAYITDSDKIAAAISKYGLRIPTKEEVCLAVKRSTDLYWLDNDATLKLNNYIGKLTDMELASVMYTNDLYHVRKCNSDFMRDMIHRFTKKETVNYDDPVAILKGMPDVIINLTHLICMDEVKGIGKDYSKISHEAICTLATTATNIVSTLDYYRDFFQAFLVTDDMPVSVAHIRNMMRRVVVVSDTDSTMFSCDEWVEWYYGKFQFTDYGYAIAAVIGFISTQAIVHVLACYSANIGVDKSKLNKIQMKPEYVFPVFIQSPVAKHYCSTMLVQEGNVFSEPQLEIKGVHFINSALGKEVVADTKAKAMAILNTIASNKKISILNEIQQLVDLERKYIDELISGTKLYYKLTTIKDEGSYKLTGEDSPYRHYLLWKSVFEAKYGEIAPPSYRGIIFPLTINNKTDMLSWMTNMEDKELANRLSAYVETTKSGLLKTIVLSEEHVKAFGIPKEIVSVLNIKRVVLDLTMSKRLLLDAIGYTLKTDMLASEQLRHLI